MSLVPWNGYFSGHLVPSKLSLPIEDRAVTAPFSPCCPMCPVVQAALPHSWRVRLLTETVLYFPYYLFKPLPPFSVQLQASFFP